MKALFIFSGIIYRKSGKYYSLNLTPSTLHKLYFPYCDELTICERVQDVEDVGGFTEISSQDIKFRCPNLPTSALSLYCRNVRDYYNFIDSIITDYDFVIARQGILGNFAAQLSRKYGIPYVYESVGSTFDSFWGHSIFGKLIALPLTFAVRWNIKKSKYVIYVTERYLQNLYPSNGHSVGVSDVEIVNMDECILSNRLRKIDDMQENASLKMVTVGGVGVKIKGQRYAIRALAELKKKGNRIEYYLVGEGDRSQLEKLSIQLGVHDQVHFVGSMKHDDIFAFLDSMDLYIQPSLQEGLPRAVVEAMSRGMLCMGSNIAGIPELIDKRFLFPKKDVKTISSIVSGISKEMLIEQAKRNFKRAESFQNNALNKKRSEFWEKFIKLNFQ